MLVWPPYGKLVLKTSYNLSTQGWDPPGNQQKPQTLMTEIVENHPHREPRPTAEAAHGQGAVSIYFFFEKLKGSIPSLPIKTERIFLVRANSKSSSTPLPSLNSHYLRPLRFQGQVRTDPLLHCVRVSVGRSNVFQIRRFMKKVRKKTPNPYKALWTSNDSYKTTI